MTYPVTAAQDPSRTGFPPTASHSQKPVSSDAVSNRVDLEMISAATVEIEEEQGGGTVQVDVVCLTTLEGVAPETLSLAMRPAAVLQIAVEQFPASESWVDFYREVLGVEGVVRRAFPTAEQMHYWEKTPEFAEVLEMLTALRSTEVSKSGAIEPQRMITIRLPLSLHESLKREAKDHHTSINKLCISKLLNGIPSLLVPREKGKIRGRKPGPQTGRGKFAGDAATE